MNTVRSPLAAGQKPKYERQKKRPSQLSPYEAYLRERQTAAHPLGIPATALPREIAAQGYQGGLSPLRSFLRGLRPTLPPEPVVRFETAPGEPMQVDWVEFRKGSQPLDAFCATLGFCRASDVEFVSDRKAGTLIDGHQKAFTALGGVPRRLLYDHLKTVVLDRDVEGPGEHRFHAGFLDYAKHCGFVIKLSRPYRARTQGKVERFNGYLRRSFDVPWVARLKPAGLPLDVVTAKVEVRHGLKEGANARIHGTTQRQPSVQLIKERPHLQPIPTAWRGGLAAARPLVAEAQVGDPSNARPVVVSARIATPLPAQHPLAEYEQLLAQWRTGLAVVQ